MWFNRYASIDIARRARLGNKGNSYATKQGVGRPSLVEPFLKVAERIDEFLGKGLVRHPISPLRGSIGPLHRLHLRQAGLPSRVSEPPRTSQRSPSASLLVTCREPPGWFGHLRAAIAAEIGLPLLSLALGL